jgi:osmotically-inducible protein OsmY
MKSDQALKQDVEQELLWDPAIDARDIMVTVHDRIVTLAGVVASYAQKLAVQKAAQRVAGCRVLVMEVNVPESSPATHSDEDLATAILSALKWQEDFPKDEIQVEVERGCVTLTGEVDWGYQRHAAEMLVSRMRGVMGVMNQITVRADQVAADVGVQISAALARRAQREFAGIEIEARDGVVTLTGTVSSLAEKRAACRAAWSAKGVQRVVDKLSVV